MSEQAWHLHPLRVRYQETDQMSVVFHGNYVTWFEIGRTEWIRSAGYDYKTIESRGLLLPVVDLQCKYVAPARYDDRVLVCTRVEESTALRVTFASQVRRVESDEQWRVMTIPQGEALPGELLAEGGTKHVWVGSDWQPVRMNRIMPELYKLLAHSGK
ncbi:thioesterase [Paenibacillus sp. MY03]|uniref:Thioesterase n=1 Tax=Paenibacillus agaridevorans TaxID=171404 RepID=A0A2R5EZS6_9BACL|nr:MULTISPECIES: thioesterase family protein [Paenibacillus]OUS77994.1 thioesterase [Paenibacillus sp. MY03]GBG08844.1 thioesterase [Paenibacillus agaridevorans]